MPNSSSVELVGMDEAERDMRRWADQLGPAIEGDSRAFAGRLGQRVAGRVPVLTGTLARSVHTETLEEEGMGVSIGDGVPYAGWIEFGGSRGRPYFPQGRYLYPEALAAEPEFTRLSESVAEATVRSYPWS